MNKLFITDAKELQTNFPFLEFEFRQTLNPLIPIELFIICAKHNIPPPQFVTDFIADSFDKYIGSDGKPGSLEKCLGLTVTAGKSSYHKKSIIENRNDAYCHNVAILVYVFGFSVKNAAKIIADHLKELRFEDACLIEPQQIEQLFPAYLKSQLPDPTILTRFFPPESFDQMIAAIKMTTGIDITDPKSKNRKGRTPKTK